MSFNQQIISALQELRGGKKFLQGKGLINRIANKTGIDLIEVRLALGKLARQGVLEGVTDHGEAFGKVVLLIETPKKKEPISRIRWIKSLHESGLTENETEALVPCHDRLDGFTDIDMKNLAKGLITLRSEQFIEKNTPRFVLSAKYLLGSSKLLGSLPPSALRAFGINIDEFPDAIPQVVVAGPENPEAVLLIENPHSFEEAVKAGCADNMALIVTYGYGLSRAGEEYGNNLVEAIEQVSRLVPLVRKGNPPTPQILLQHSKIFFWGDLDKEGLRIFCSLRKRIAALQISALYLPMIEAMQRGDSHPYAKATAKERQGTTKNLPLDLSTLVEICENRAVDQEIVCQQDILKLATKSIYEIL